jgi:hypothetical protein
MSEIGFIDNMYVEKDVEIVFFISIEYSKPAMCKWVADVANRFRASP